MDIKPLYELKERLEHTALAGTRTLSEDFRLKRAIEALTPLAAASPVFAKIKAGADDLLQAPSEQRSAKLLELLSLVDAVTYTQGVTGVQGELTPLPTGNGAYVPVTYGQLEPLIAALTSTGSGRMSVIEGCWNEHPDYFGDFRILPHVVTALGSSYAELADLAEKILLRQGKYIVPLLKDGFAPDGKKEMVRRVHLVAALDGAEQNEWYLHILPDSQKAVREAVIAALGLSQNNTAVLLDLCRSERGSAKKAALRSLSCMDTPEARGFWEAESKKHPKSVYELEGANARLAADVTAQALQAAVQELLETKEPTAAQLEHFRCCVHAAYGKYSDRMQDFWLWVTPRLEALDDNKASAMSRSDMLEKCLVETVKWNPCPDTFALARELFETAPQRFIGAAFAADWLEHPAEEVYDKYAPYFDPAHNQEQEAYRVQILCVLRTLAYNDGAFQMGVQKKDEIFGDMKWENIPVNHPDAGWAKLLTHPKLNKHYECWDTHPWYEKTEAIQWDILMANLIDPQSPEVCAAIGQYLYQLLWQTGQLHRYVRWLLRCGWTQWEGVLVHCVKQTKEVEWYYLKPMLESLPVSGKIKAKELKEIDHLVWSKQVKTRYSNGFGEEVQTLIARWEAEE